MTRIVSLGLVLALLAAPAFAQNLSKPSGGSSSGVSVETGTDVPDTCTPGTGPNALFLDTDGDANARLYVCTATDVLTPVLDAEVQGLSAVLAIDRIDGDADSEADAFAVGSSATNRYWIFFDHSADGLIATCKVNDVLHDCDKGFLIIATRKFYVADASGNRTINFEPNAATSAEQYALGTKKAKVSFMVPLNPRGAATGGYESILTNQPSEYYLTLTDANTDAADFTFFVNARKAGATTATFRLVGVSKNASPSGNIDFDCAMSKFTPGTNTYTAHVTTGEVTALLTPATQNRPVAVTTAAHTINGGALVAGDVVKGSCEVDATATTSAQMSDFRLEGYVFITLESGTLSD